MSSSARLELPPPPLQTCKQKSGAERARGHSGRREAELPGAGMALGSLGRPASALAHALLQTYTAVYYVLADVLMLSLYFYYKFKQRPLRVRHGGPWASGAWGPGRRGGGSVPLLVTQRTLRKASSGLVSLPQPDPLMNWGQ